MEAKELSDVPRGRAFVIVLRTDDEVVSSILDFARQHTIDGAFFTAIGALRDVTVAYWSAESQNYQNLGLHEQVEVVGLIGNLSLEPDGKRRVHAHLVVGKADGSTFGGHLVEAKVHPTLELLLTETPAPLRRRKDPATGLWLLDSSDS